MKNKQKKCFKQQMKRQLEGELIAIQEQTKLLKRVDPDTLQKFTDFPLSKATLRGLKDNKFTQPTHVQRLSLPHALLGHDVVVDAKTGSGKTLAFVIPILEKLFKEKWDANSGLGAIIITPTRELAYQIHEILRLLTKYHRFTSTLVIGGKDLSGEMQFIDSFNIIVCTPGRLHQHLSMSKILQTDDLKILVLDEADMCLSMGFANEMNDILLELPKNRQTMLFSATQTRNVTNLIRSGCKKPVFCSTHEYTQNITPVSLEQHYVVCEAHQKLDFLFSFLKYYRKKKILVFMATCKQVKFFHEIFVLLELNMKVLSLHGQMKQERRMKIYDTFIGESKIVMLATDVAARGLDFAEVDWVIQMDCPEDATTYVHRVGRTARYFDKGNALLMLTSKEKEGMLRQLQLKKVPIKPIETDAKSVESVQGRVQDIFCKEPALLEVADRAFKAYLKGIAYLKDRTVFDVTSIDRELFAKSYGLSSAPRVRFIEKLIKLNEKQAKSKAEKSASGVVNAIHEKNNSDESDTESNTEIDHQDILSDVDDEVAQIVENDGAEVLYKNEAVKQATIVASSLHIKERYDDLFAMSSENKIVTALPQLGERLSSENIDYSKYIKKYKGQENNVSAEAEAGADLSLVEAAFKSSKLSNRRLQKQKLRQKRREKEQKREKSSKKDEKAYDSGDESDIDEFTQQIIDELPDPDKYKEGYEENGSLKRERDEDDDDDVYRGEKVPCKRIKEDESSDDEDSEEEFGGMGLQEQEQLALQLLSAKR